MLRDCAGSGSPRTFYKVLRAQATFLERWRPLQSVSREGALASFPALACS